MQQEMHTTEIKDVFVSIHINTVKDTLELTHMQRHTPLTKGALMTFLSPLAYCGDPCRHDNVHLLTPTHKNTQPVIDS